MFDCAPAPGHALMQDPAFAAALRLCGQAPVLLRGGETVLVRRIAGMRIAMLPRALPPPTLMRDLRDAGLHRLPLILSPERPCAALRALPLARARAVAILDLSAGDPPRRGALHPKWRNQLRRAEAAGLRVSVGTMPPDHPLLALEAAQARARGYAGWPPALTAAFARVAPGQTRILTAWQGRRALAHMLFLLHGTRASYHIGHTTDAGRAAHAHNLLLWRATCLLHDAGVSELDLGPLDRATPGLDRFKLRSGAVARRTGGTWLHWHPFGKAARN